jgi:transglutaminase-like putative cysteine protease
MNKIILSLGGVDRLNGVCPENATDEQLAAFLSNVSFVEGRAPITVQEVRDRAAEIAAQEAAAASEARNLDALQYLASTDWYVARMAETGTPIPDDILAARAAARNSVER